MFSVRRSQHIDRLDHMRVTSDQCIYTQVAELAGDLLLLLGLLSLIFCTPMHIGDGILCAIFLHAG